MGLGAVNVANDEKELVATPGATHQKITVSNSVKQIGALQAQTEYVLVTVDSNNVRVTFDGADPASDDGHLLTAPYTGMWSRARAVAAKFIRVSADALLFVSEFVR